MITRREIIVTILGIVLSYLLIAVGMVIVFRTTTAGELIRDSYHARNDPQALDEVLAKHDDAFELATRGMSRNLGVVGVLTSIVVGCFVGWFASTGRSWWLGVVSVLPLAISRLGGDFGDFELWLWSGACIVAAGGAASLVVRNGRKLTASTDGDDN